MAMNKSEKAEFEAFKLERDMARSLRWPEYRKPSTMTDAEIQMEKRGGGGFNDVARGWFCNAYSGSVTYGCSNGVNHNRDGDRTTTQGTGKMYRYKSEALRAMRIEMTIDYAKKLAAVDWFISEALDEEGGAA